MTSQQITALRRIGSMGYQITDEFVDRNERVRVTMVRKLRRGVFSVLIMPGGSMRGTQYERWDNHKGAYN